MPKLSVIVITHNEEACIARCLGSVGFADEIVVVDNNSSDNTRNIARGLGAKVVNTPDWPGFGVQKNRALAAATGDWVLSLDADEWIEAPLAAEIKAIVSKPDGMAGFMIPRRSRFCGRVVRHGTWSPDLVLRLFRREAGRFTNDTVHEKVVLKGQASVTSQSMEHDCITDLRDAYEKIDRYAEASACRLHEQGKRSSIGKAISHSIWAYLYSYVIRLGCLDGFTGLMVAAYSASYTYKKWARVPASVSASVAGKRRAINIQ